MMQSLRARLIAGLLALTAVGLLAAATVTYVEQRSFLLDRVDEQAVAAAPAMAHQLDESGYPPPQDAVGFPRGPPGGGRGARERPPKRKPPARPHRKRPTAAGKGGGGKRS